MTGFFFGFFSSSFPSARHTQTHGCRGGCRVHRQYAALSRQTTNNNTMPTKLMYNLIRNSYVYVRRKCGENSQKYIEMGKRKKESKKLTRRIRPIYNPSCFHFAVYTHTHTPGILCKMALYTHRRAQRAVVLWRNLCVCFSFYYYYFCWFSNFPHKVYRTFYLTSCPVAIVHHGQI
jgi:hypothetical protein